MRCCEQVRTFICYPNLNVKIIAGLGGFSAGIEGVTHLATEDLGILRCIPNITIIGPSDAIMTKEAVKASASHPGPVYIRLGRDSSPKIHDDNFKFIIGKPVLHRQGKDVTLITNGQILWEVLEAAKLLSTRGISAGVIEIPTIKPLYFTEMIIKEVTTTRKIISIEEHNINGGLGSIIAELLVGIGKIKMKKLGLPDTFAESGTPEELREKYKLSAGQILREAQDFISKG